VADGEGHFRQADGDRFGCGEWRTSYVRSILSDRRALGELQPCNAAGRPVGDVIKGYYPAVVGPDEFYAARAAVTGRRNQQGRIGNGVANLFGGLMRNARDGSTYYAATRSDGGRLSKILINKTGIEGRSRYWTFPYATAERALLSHLREIDPADVLGRQDGPAGPAVLQGELAWVRERKAALAAELLKGDVPEIAEALRQMKVREAELVAALDDAEQEAAKPLGESWQEAQTLVGLLDAAPDQEDVRLRLRAAIRRVVKEVWLFVTRRGQDRYAAVQVVFAGRDPSRLYCLYQKPPSVNAAGAYVPFNRTIAVAIGLDAAAVLLNLLTTPRLCADVCGFMLATPSYNCHGVGIGEEREAAAMDKLSRSRLIEIQYRDHKRYVRVDLDRLEAIQRG
jgi:hypothetical protein